jgi:deoxyribonuclease V
MIACVDVDYREAGAVAACVLFRDWPDERPTAEVVVPIGAVAPYEPGRFYRRELPCLLTVLGAVDERPRTVLIDGYVWLGDGHEPGLGAHLYEAMGQRAAVIGVAKTRFYRARPVAEVLRGASRSPLFVTAVGIDLAEAARRLGEMHGPYRIPTLLKRVDRLCREEIGTIRPR